MAPSKHLLAAFLAVFLLIFSHSVARLDETDDPGKFDSNGDCENKGNAKGCHFAGTCSSGADCRKPCAALGRNPYAVKCVSSPGGGNHCCCMDYS